MLTLPDSQPAPHDPEALLTLDAGLLELVGYELAWEHLSWQVAARHTVPLEVAVRLRHVPRRQVPAERPVLWHLVDADPTLLARITWAPEEHKVAAAVLDRAVADRLERDSPGRTSLERIDFWTAGRHLTVVTGRTVPTVALPWLSTGDWSATEVVPAGPEAVLTDLTGEHSSYLDGRLHRDDGPAVILTDGSVHYFRQGRRHRDDGPAVILTDGYMAWYRDGVLHRDGGPAVVRHDGRQQRWVAGVQVLDPPA